MARLSASLEQRLRTASPDELLEVIVEVKETTAPAPLPAAKGERYAALAQHFRSATAPITLAIDTLGGKVLERTFMGSALKVLVPANRVKTLLSIDDVTLVDLDARIKR